YSYTKKTFLYPNGVAASAQPYPAKQATSTSLPAQTFQPARDSSSASALPGSRDPRTTSRKTATSPSSPYNECNRDYQDSERHDPHSTTSPGHNSHTHSRET